MKQLADDAPIPPGLTEKSGKGNDFDKFTARLGGLFIDNLHWAYCIKAGR